MFTNPFIFIIIILVFSSKFTYSVPLIERDDTLSCQGTNEICCPFLAHQVASQHNSRCASIILINKSGYNMTLNGFLEDGNWLTPQKYKNINRDCGPQASNLETNQSVILSSVTSHFLGGLKGYATFTIDDKASSTFIIAWKVPTIGSPNYSIDLSSKDKDIKKKYDLTHQSILEDTVFQVTVDLHFSLWSITKRILFHYLPCIVF